MFSRFRHRRCDGVGVRHVAMDGERGVRRRQRLEGPLQQLAFDVEQRDPPAFGDEFLRRRQADAARRARHQRDLLLLFHHGCLNLRP